MRRTQSAKRKANTRITLCAKRHAPCAFPLAAGGKILKEEKHEGNIQRKQFIR
jgi:hypothetical protein